MRHILSILLIVFFTFFQLSPVAIADTISTGWDAGSIPTVTVQGVPMPDWSRISFASLPPVQTDGNFSIPPDAAANLGYDPSRSWQAGTALADLLTLGDVQQDFGLEKLTLAAIAQKTGMDLRRVSLSSFGLLKQQTISSLVAAVPGLGNYPLASVKPLAEIVQHHTSHPVNVSLTIGNEMPLAIVGLTLMAQIASPPPSPSSSPATTPLSAASNDPIVGNISLDSLSLDHYAITDIPGLTQTSLESFDGWQQAAINLVPGLANVPFNATPQAIGDFAGFVALDDVTYGDTGDVEHTRTETVHSITGSDRVGFHYQCAQDRSCAYLELANFSALGSFGSPELHGAQWIKGGTDPGGQMVDGGHGVLGAVNGGKEPTGRLPFGSAVKVVLTGDDEAQGSGQFGLYFRVCAGFLGCTPYFIGPIPFYTVHEKGIVIVGLTQMDEPSWITQPGTPSDVQSIIDANQPDSATGGETPMNCTSGILATVNRGDEEAASTDLPGILKMIQQAGVTDPAQQAYILATAQTEDDFTPRDEGRDKLTNSGSAGIYTGRGDVQLTGRSNYQYWTNRLGVDLINHPELANRPDLSAEILVYGMRDGTFTGRKLSQYINSSTGHFDFAGARHIVNDSDKTGTTAQNAQRYYNTLKTCSSSSGGSGGSSSGGATTTQNYAGKLISTADGNATEQKIVQAINARYGESSKDDPGTGGGANACAYELNRVLQDAMGHKIGGADSDNVIAVNHALDNGDGTAINASEAHAGDIIISPGDAHIGFCISNGCSQVLSNSSSKGHFSWTTSLSGWNSYWQQRHPGQSQFYRVNG